MRETLKDTEGGSFSSQVVSRQSVGTLRVDRLDPTDGRIAYRGSTVTIRFRRSLVYIDLTIRRKLNAR